MVYFEFYTVIAGWIEGQIIVDEKNKYFHYSWITNFLDDLLKAVLYIGGYLDNANLDKFTAHLEPAIDDWSLSKKGTQLMIAINRCENETRKELIESVRMQCDYYDFVQSFFNALTKIIKKTGLYGYRVEWNEEFPLALYLKLYDVVNNTDFLDLKELTLEETCGRKGQATDINKEFALLTDIFNL